MTICHVLSKTALALTITMSVGCASIISDSSYPVAMTSSPSGATFEIRNESGAIVHQGTTPNTVTLKAGDGFFSGAHYSVRYKKDGYSDQNGSINPSVDGWYVANIIFGGVIGLLIVDPATGAMYKLPESHNASLSPVVTEAPADGESSLQLVSIEQLTEAQRPALVRVQ